MANVNHAGILDLQLAGFNQILERVDPFLCHAPLISFPSASLSISAQGIEVKGDIWVWPAPPWGLEVPVSLPLKVRGLSSFLNLKEFSSRFEGKGGYGERVWCMTFLPVGMALYNRDKSAKNARPDIGFQPYHIRPLRRQTLDGLAAFREGGAGKEEWWGGVGLQKGGGRHKLTLQSLYLDKIYWVPSCMTEVHMCH